MTIALAVLAADGVVLAADTEETAGPFKSSVSKITNAIYQNNREPTYSRSACGFSGAGSGPHLDLLMEEWSHVFLENAVPVDGQPRRALAKHLAGFYREHLLPFAHLPYGDRPDVDPIVVWSAGPRAQILIGYMTTLREGHGIAAVGLGSGVASILLRRMWRPTLSIKAAALIAAYAAWSAKENIGCCGKSTEILILQNGEGAYVPWEAVRDLEQVFRRVAGLEAHVAGCIFGSQTETDVIVPTALELREECESRLSRLLPLRIHSAETADGIAGVLADNHRVDFERRSSDPEFAPNQPIQAVKRARRSSTRDRKARPPSRG